MSAQGPDDDPLDAHGSRQLLRKAEEEGLLKNWKQEGPVDLDEEQPSKSFQEGSKRRSLAWTVVAIVFSASVLLVSVGFLLRLSILTPNHGNLRVNQPEDYMLDPNWDYQAPPQRRTFKWTIRDHVYNPDGVYRPMILVNNQFPGPMIEVNEGDTIVVHIDNQAVNATSIHWHGIYQNRTPWEDGTVGVTQCPIAPGSQFTYEFTVSGQSGTYWWHAHYGIQASDGLHGPLIIHSRKERELQQFQYATDRVLLISDHYHDLSSALLWQYLKPDMENAEPVPNSGLINGVNILNCENFPFRRCDNQTSSVRLPEVHLEAGQRHRLRLINVGAFAEFQVQIDEHELAVTEVDGTDVIPAKYHRISINPGQRYSVVVDASVSTADMFWLRALMVTTCFNDVPDNLQTEVLGIVRYSDGKPHDLELRPISKDWQEMADIDCKDMDASELRPVEVVLAPLKPDSFFFIRSNFEIGAYRLSRGFFNSSSWRPDIRSPSLVRSIDGLSTLNSSFDSIARSSTEESPSAFVNDIAFDASRELVIQTTGIQIIDILISNFDDGNHPMHLHGHKYFVLAEGDGYPPLIYPGADITYENLSPLYQSLDLFNPLRRDTASVEAFGWLLIRFVADNPGAWAFHCHVSWHSEAGLLMQFLTRSEELAKMRVPDDMIELCRSPGLEKGMGPDDEVYEDLAK